MGIEGNLVRALALLSGLFEDALAREFELGDIDDEVVIEQLDCAGRDTTAALFQIRPDLGCLPPEDRVELLDCLFEEHDDGLAPDDPDYLIFAAWNELNEAHGRRQLEEIDAAMSHLDVVMFLRDPDIYHRPMADASPVERVQLASQLECVELMLEESRSFVLEDRRSSGFRPAF